MKSDALKNILLTEKTLSIVFEFVSPSSKQQKWEYLLERMAFVPPVEFM